MVQEAEHPSGYILSTDRSRIDVDWVLRMLQAGHWAKDRSRGDMERIIANSYCWGIYTPGGEQVGFGRLISDTCVIAYVMDVLVDPEHQRKGLASWLMRQMESHPDLRGVRTWRLQTTVAQGLYEGLGWKKTPNPDSFMDKFHEV